MFDHSQVKRLGTGMPGVLCLAMLALAAGTVTVNAGVPWTVGDVVVCIGGGTCTTYPTTGTPTMIQVPTNPKKETGGIAWTGGFDAWVVDSRNQQLVLFSKTTQAVLKTVDTSAQSSGHPGPIVIDSAGSLYVGMYDAPTVLKYDSAGTYVATFTTGVSAPAWMDLADDHKTLWFTTTAFPRELERIDLTGATTPGPFALPIEAGAAAGGFRLLPLASPFDGTGGFLLADAVNIKRFGSSGPPQVYDVTGEDGWRTVTLEPNGTTFLAATAAGRIYRFPLAGGAGAVVAETGSSEISGLSAKGGVQLNVRPLNFSAGTNVQREAVYGNPTAIASDPFPRHSIGVNVASSPSPFTLLTSDNWAATDGVCQGDATTDYDCRTTQAFGTDPAPSPRCLPYVSSSAADCVFYRYEDEAATLPVGVTSEDFVSFVDYHEPGKRASSPYEHPGCTANVVNGNPRLLRDPDPTPGQFEADITIGITRTSATDPIFGSGKGSGSDYGAFDRCLADGVGATTASFAKPSADSSNRFGSSIPFLLFVVDGNGNDVTDAVDAPNNISLSIRHSTGQTFLAPQPTPGSSPVFFQKVTVKMGKTKRTGYAANLDTATFVGSNGQPLLGSYVACATSINQGAGTTAGQPGQFAPVCIGLSLF